MSITDKELKRAIELLKEEQAQEAEKEPGLLQRLNESKNFDFLTGSLLGLLLGFLSYVTPMVIVKYIPDMSVFMAEKIEKFAIASFLFYLILLSVDISVYFREKIIWQFLKRNGDNSFDFQENIKALTPYQQCIIALIKYSSLLYLYAFLM